MKGRGPVVHLDRRQKAEMIEAVLADALKGPVRGFRILDIGCGNGRISSYFARKNEQYGVDISDRRAADSGGFTFKLVCSEELPFEDGFFDIVLSHHVIEHVGNQDLHLEEIRRVLRPGGLAYLATPNKSSPIMEGHIGNDLVLRYRRMAPLFRRHGFSVSEYGVKLLRAPDRYSAEIRWGRFLPRPLLKLLRPLFPSHVFVLSPCGQDSSVQPSRRAAAAKVA